MTTRVLLTGATGTLGQLLLVALLERDDQTQVIAPVRQLRQREALVAAVSGELHRVDFPVWPDITQSTALDQLFASAKADIVLHAAGCLHYFDKNALTQGNEVLTQALMTAASRHGVEKFVYVSTAFCNGFSSESIEERIYRSPPDGKQWQDPNAYTRSKRHCEWIIADGDVPWLILRPSVVIGASQSGRYAGRRYGLYQLWSGVERYLTSQWHRELHAIVNDTPMPLVHQDAFVNATLSAIDHLEDNQVCHITGPGPSTRELTDLILSQVLRPDRIHYHAALEQAPINDLSPQLRTFLTLCAAQFEVASQPWMHSTRHLDRLRADGLQYQPVSAQSVNRCQNAFVRSSRKFQRYIRHHRPQLEVAPQAQ